MKFFNIENVQKLLINKGIYWDGKILDGGFKERERRATQEDFEKDYGYPVVELLYLEGKTVFNMFLRLQDAVLEVYQERYDEHCDEDYLYLIENFSEDWQNQNLAQYGASYAEVLKTDIDKSKNEIEKRYGEEIAKLEAQIELLRKQKNDELKPLLKREEDLNKIEEEPKA